MLFLSYSTVLWSARWVQVLWRNMSFPLSGTILYMTQCPRLGGTWWLFNPPGTHLNGWNARYHIYFLHFHAVFIKYFRSFSVFSYSFSSSAYDNSHQSPFLFYPLLFALFLLFPSCVSFPGEKSTGSQEEEHLKLNNHFSLTPLWRELYADEFS